MRMLFKRKTIATGDKVTLWREGLSDGKAMDDQPLTSQLNGRF